MPARRRDPPPDDPEQSKRFIDMAREVGADETPAPSDIFERVVRQLGATPKELHRTKERSAKKGRK